AAPAMIARSKFVMQSANFRMETLKRLQRFQRHERQHDVRRALAVDEHGIRRHAFRLRAALWLAGVRVDVVARKVAGRDVEPDTVARLEEIARRERLACDFIS